MKKRSKCKPANEEKSSENPNQLLKSKTTEQNRREVNDIIKPNKKRKKPWMDKRCSGIVSKDSHTQ